MINLDDFSSFSRLDPKNMLAEIDNLPNQLQTAWELGLAQPLPNWTGIRQVLISGMGGSAIGADLLSAYLTPHCPVPVIVHRDYGLPAWARGLETLVITSSHSGKTEETLSSFTQAVKNGCRCLVVCTGGDLAQAGSQAGFPVWTFKHTGQPRSAVGFSFGLLLAAFARLGLAPNPVITEMELKGAVQAMQRQQDHLRAEVPTAQNPAKRLAGQFMGRWVTVFGAEILAPVARRWKGQINEIGKAAGHFEFLPEADHNALAGSLNPPALLSSAMLIFLRARAYQPRNLLRADLTRKVFMLEGWNTDFVDAQGETPLANQWTTLNFGDYVAYFLAMTYGVDPTPVEALTSLKEEMSAHK